MFRCVTRRNSDTPPTPKARPPRKRAGPRLGKFWRRFVRVPNDVFERDIASMRAKPELPDGLAIPLAEIARTFTSSLVAAQRLPSAREVATALGDIQAWAQVADEAAPPPWAHLPMVPTPIEADPARAALTLVGVEARAIGRNPSLENFAHLADAAARAAAELIEIASKRGASGPLGAARHAEAAAMVAAVASEFHKLEIATPLRHPDEWQDDWDNRPVFVAVKAVLVVSEAHLEGLREVERALAHNALLTLRAARDAPYTLVQIVRSTNRRRRASE